MDNKIHYQNDSGVTLVEVLVSFVLLSILSVLLLAGLRQAATVDGLSQDAQFQADTHFALDHMANILRSAVALKLIDSSGRPIPVISGTSNQLQFYTLSDGTVLTGGIYQLRWIEQKSEGESPALLEEWRIIANLASGATGIVISKPVVKKLDTIKFRYLARSDVQSGANWQENWNSGGKFPAAIEIVVSQFVNNKPQTFSRIVQMLQ